MCAQHPAPRSPREQALPAMRRGLDTIAKDLKGAIPGIGVQATDLSATDALRLTLALHDCRIKIEVSPVARGAVWPPETRAVPVLFGAALARVPVASGGVRYPHKAPRHTPRRSCHRASRAFLRLRQTLSRVCLT